MQRNWGKYSVGLEERFDKQSWFYQTAPLGIDCVLMKFEEPFLSVNCLLFPGKPLDYR